MRSTTQRYRPRRSDESMPRRAKRGLMPRARRARRRSAESYALSAWRLAGHLRGRPGRPRGPMMGGMASTKRRSWVAWWALAAERRTAKGTPLRSTMRWYLEPGLPRSTGFGPAASPPFGAHTQGVDAGSGPVVAASSPSQLSSFVCNVSQTPAACQSRKRRQQVVAATPQLLGEQAPGTARAQDEDDAGKDGAFRRRGRPPFGLGGSVGSNGSGFPEIIGDKGRGVHGPPSCHASVLQHGLSKLGAANRRDAAAIAARSRLI